VADILKITTPLVSKNVIQPSKQTTDPTIPFNLGDVTKVIKPQGGSELLSQNSGTLVNDEAPSILANLLKDPAVTVSFLKNIFMLQEMIALLPANNNTVTEEIQQLFGQLLISQDLIVPELVRQENSSTAFKGGLFNFLRKLSMDAPSPETKAGIANLLKALNGALSKRDILDSIANGLQFLSKELLASPTLAKQLDLLSANFRQKEAIGKFSDLKQETLSLLHEVEGSILYSPKIAKIVPIIIYNLSRFQDNPDFLRESINDLLMIMDNKEQKAELVALLKESSLPIDNFSSEEKHSKVMRVLAEIIGKQTGDPAINIMNSDKIEKIIHSLLSSPCNFTPLLHFVIPVQFEGIRSFAELWIDPNSGEKTDLSKDGFSENVHMLIVFDIEGIGQFEAELFLVRQMIRFTLLCPPAYLTEFLEAKPRFVKALAGSSYRFSEISIAKLDQVRSLMEVFKSLPYRRTGVNVKI